MEKFDDDSLNLSLGLPGSENIKAGNKRSATVDCCSPSKCSKSDGGDVAPPEKAKVVGWPPIRTYRKNNTNPMKSEANYVKVSVDGAPYLRKIDLSGLKTYPELLKELENLFNLTIGNYAEREGCNNGSDFAPTYEDKDGDWMLVGDVPWNMFVGSCKRLRIIKGSEARTLGCA